MVQVSGFNISLITHLRRFRILLHHHGEQSDEVQSGDVTPSQKSESLSVFSFLELWLSDEIRRIRGACFDAEYLKGGWHSH